MKYEPWKIIEDSFRKYIITPKEIQQRYEAGKNDVYFHYDSPEEYFEGQLEHNLEYFKWHINKETGTIKFGKYEPLGLFYGRSKKVPLINKELCKYVTECRGYLLAKIETAIFEIQSYRIPVGEIQLPKSWGSLVCGALYGVSVTTNYTPRVLSEDKYGRFVVIEGIEK